MRAKTIVFYITTPMDIDALGALRERSDSITPVVIVGEASSRPSQNRDTQFTKVLNSLFTITVDVGNRRSLADPQATINTRAKMFGKMSVKLRPHQSDLNVRVDQHPLGAGGAGLRPKTGRKQREQRACSRVTNKLPSRQNTSHSF